MKQLKKYFMSKEEEWKDIKLLGEIYQVSSFGRIRKIVYLKNGDLNGYKKLSIRRNGKNKTYTIHRLVAHLFIPNVNKKPVINHIDGNKANNVITNLEWASHKENCQHAVNNKLVIHKGRTRIQRPVLQFSKKGEFIAEFINCHKASLSIGKLNGSGNISQCCKGINPTAYGYVWQFNESNVKEMFK